MRVLGLVLAVFFPGGRPGFLLVIGTSVEDPAMSIGIWGPSLCRDETHSVLVGESSSRVGGACACIEAKSIMCAVSSICPCSSAWRSLSLRAALFVGSAHIVY
ncbi:hypothetical protein Bca52824_088391 [Brassica carinata]|uniref:Secreted protein n=1 Tax=Brassica carinata TaxID=52824 RepID=A0A8X7PDK6_BRACI|nr:hypothetical protein Bca52824_088391 [Brassica carinata]